MFSDKTMAYLTYKLLTFVIIFCYCYSSETFPRDDDPVHTAIHLRLETLKRFATSSSNRKSKCPTNKWIIITDKPYGRTGNHIISLAHGLWFADKFNATLVVPHYMQSVFEPFRTDVFESTFCVTFHNPTHAAQVIQIRSENMFLAYKVYQEERWKHVLGPFTDTTRVEISRYLLRVYASLWGTTNNKIVDAAARLINDKLNGNMQYSSVHIRQMEGGCSRLMWRVTKEGDFSAKELPMDRPEWKAGALKGYPLCDMEYDFVNAVFAMHKRNTNKVFVAYDELGNIDAYQQHNAVFSSQLQSEDLKSGYEVKYLDMLMCILSDFFLFNPRSTFGFQIMATRLMLALESVPNMRKNDLFVQQIPEELENPHRDLWINWESLVKALV